MSPSLSMSPAQAPELSWAVAPAPEAAPTSTKVRLPLSANWLSNRLLAVPGPLVT